MTPIQRLDEMHALMPDLFEGTVAGVWLAFRLQVALEHGYRAGREEGASDAFAAPITKGPDHASH